MQPMERKKREKDVRGERKISQRRVPQLLWIAQRDGRGKLAGWGRRKEDGQYPLICLNLPKSWFEYGRRKLDLPDTEVRKLEGKGVGLWRGILLHVIWCKATSAVADAFSEEGSTGLLVGREGP